MLKQCVKDAYKQKDKGKKVVSDIPESDKDYDPTSNIDIQSDSDDDSDADLTNEVNDEARCITMHSKKLLVSLFANMLPLN